MDVALSMGEFRTIDRFRILAGVVAASRRHLLVMDGTFYSPCPYGLLFAHQAGKAFLFSRPFFTCEKSGACPLLISIASPHNSQSRRTRLDHLRPLFQSRTHTIAAEPLRCRFRR